MDSIDQVLIAFEDFLADHNIDVYDEAEVAEDKYKLSAVIVEDGMSELKLRLRLQRTIADANTELTSLSKVTLSGLKVNSTSPDEIDFTFTVIFEGEKEEEKVEEKEELVIEDAKPAGPTKLAIEVLMDRHNGAFNIVSQFVNEYPDAKTAAHAAKIFEKKKINKFQSALSPENYQKLVADLKEWSGNDQTAFDAFEYRTKLTDSAAADTKLTDEKDGNLCVCPRCLRGIENHDGPQATEHFYLEEPIPCDWCGEETDEIYEIFEDRDAGNYTTESDEDLGEEIEYFYHDSVKAEDDDTENKKYLTKQEWVDYINQKGEAGKYYGAVVNEKGDKVIFWTGASKGFDLRERAEEYARQQYDLATRGKRVKGAKFPTFITRIAKPAPEQEEYYLVENKNSDTGATHATVYKTENAAIRSIKTNRDTLTRQANYQCEVIDDPSSEDDLAEYYYAEKFTKKDRPTYIIGVRKIDKEEASKFSAIHDEKSVKDDDEKTVVVVEEKNVKTGKVISATAFRTFMPSLRHFNSLCNDRIKDGYHRVALSSNDLPAGYSYIERFVKTNDPDSELDIGMYEDGEDAVKADGLLIEDSKKVKDDFWGDPGCPSPEDVEDVYFYSDFSQKEYDAFDEDNGPWSTPDGDVGTCDEVFQDFIKRTNFKHVDVKDVPMEVQKYNDRINEGVWFKYNDTNGESYIVTDVFKGNPDNPQSIFEFGNDFGARDDVTEILDSLGYHKYSAEEIWDKFSY